MLSIYNLGFSGRPGRRALRQYLAGIGAPRHRERPETTQRLPFVDVTTIDLFCAEHRIERINLLKIDTEGHDLDVIRGASNMLRRGEYRRSVRRVLADPGIRAPRFLFSNAN